MKFDFKVPDRAPSKYEACLLVDQHSKREECFEKFAAMLEKIGGEYKILSNEFLFTQQLRYRIGNMIRGTYLLVRFEARRSMIPAIIKALAASKHIARSIVLNHDANRKLFEAFDYKNFEALRKHLSETGRILPSSLTNLRKKEQKLLSKSIKIARFMGLIEFTTLKRK